MPCGFDEEGKPAAYCAVKADEAIRLLCAVMNWVGNAKSHAFTCVPGLEEWWAEHQAQDQARREADARRLEQEKQRLAALDKLTPEERWLLGIR